MEGGPGERGFLRRVSGEAVFSQSHGGADLHAVAGWGPRS